MDIIAELIQELEIDSRNVVFDLHVEFERDVPIFVGEIGNYLLYQQTVALIAEKTSNNFLNRIAVLPEQRLISTPFSVASRSVVTLYRVPSHSSEILTQAFCGTPLELLKKEKEWFLVRLPDGYIGWSYKPGPLMSVDQLRDWKNKSKHIIIEDWCRLLRRPKTNEIVCDLVSGDVVEFVDATEDWLHVRLPDGRDGYVAENYSAALDLAMGKLNCTPETVLATAYRFFGLPYLWGGISSKGMDCSGFVKTAFFLNGIFLPRDADQQALIGEPVATINDTLPGDLLFFSSNKKSESFRITHVGIALGSCRFIHQSGDVHENSLDKNHQDYSADWDEQFVFARRILCGGEPCAGIQKVSKMHLY